MTYFLEIPMMLLIAWVTWRLQLVEKSVKEIREFLSQGAVTSVNIDAQALKDAAEKFATLKEGNHI